MLPHNFPLLSSFFFSSLIITCIPEARLQENLFQEVAGWQHRELKSTIAWKPSVANKCHYQWTVSFASSTREHYYQVFNSDCNSSRFLCFKHSFSYSSSFVWQVAPCFTLTHKGLSKACFSYSSYVQLLNAFVSPLQMRIFDSGIKKSQK